MSDEVPIPERMYNAVKAGDLETLKSLLTAHPEFFRYPNGLSMWLSDSASAGQLEVVKWLVSQGVDVNEPANLDSTPSPENVLKCAAAKGHTHVVRWMLDQGAQINYTVDDRVRCFVLVSACRYGRLDIIKLLIERGAALNAVWAEMTALDHAIFAGEDAAADYLRSIGGKQADEIAG